VSTVPIAIIRSVVAITIIRSIVVSTVPIAIIRSVVMSVVPIPPIPIIDLLHLASTVARGKWQNAGLRGNGSGCVDHQDDDKRES
jgi:hypothetical protein